MILFIYLLSVITDLDLQLKNQVINKIYKDSYGYTWFASNSGLYSYNGKSTEYFQYSETDSLSLNHDITINIMEDNESNLWVLTSRGMNLFERETKTFRPSTAKAYFTKSKISKDKSFSYLSSEQGLFRFNFKDKSYQKILGKNFSFITGITEINKEDIIFVKNDTQLYFSIKNKRPKKLPLRNSLKIDFIKKLVYQNNRLWLATDKGLYFIDSVNFKSNQIEKYSEGEFEREEEILDIVRDDCGKLICLVKNKGIYNYDSYFNEMIKINNTISISDISTTYPGTNYLWLGFKGQGVKVIPRQRKHYRLFSHRENDLMSISNNLVWSIIEDKNKQLWMITNDHTLNLLDKKEKRFIKFKPPEKKKSFHYLHYDGKYLWLNNEPDLIFFDTKKRSFTPIPEIESLFKGYRLRYLFTENQEDFFIGSNSVLIYFNKKTLKIKRIKLPEHASHIQYIIRKNKNTLYISTRNGLFEFNDKSLHFKKKVIFKDKLKNIQAIFKKDSLIWFASFDKGLTKLNTKTKKFRSYSRKDGLINNTIYSILEDNQDHLWLSTNNGISEFNPEDETFNNYIDLIPITEFNQLAYMKNSDHTFYYGSVSGLVNICPSVLKKTKNKLGYTIEINSKPYSLKQEQVFKTENKDLELLLFSKNYKDSSLVKYRINDEKSWNHWDLNRKLQLKNKTVRQLELIINSDRPLGLTKRYQIKFARFENASLSLLVPLTLIILVLIEMLLLFHFKRNRLKKIKRCSENEIFKELDIKLNILFSTEKIYKDSNLKVDSVAKRLRIQSRDLSYYLNHFLNTNFNDYINKYRLEDAKSRIINSYQNDENISEIAYEVGFNSQTTFINSFKKRYKMTPSSFRKNNIDKNQYV